MHRGRAVCSAAGEITFGRRAIVVDPSDERSRAFPTASGTRDHAISAIDKIPKRKTDSPAPMRGMLFLAA